MDKRRLGAWLLVPGAIIFTLRATLELLGRDPGRVALLGPLTGIGGALSLVGVVLVLWAAGLVAAAGAACVLVGHFAVSPHGPDLGAGLVYLGTGLLVARWAPHAAAAGALAMVGALVREASVAGHGLVALGAAWLAAELIQVARHEHTRSNMFDHAGLGQGRS